MACRIFFSVYVLLIGVAIFYPEQFLHQQVTVFGIGLTPLAAIFPVALLAFMGCFLGGVREFRIAAIDIVLFVTLAYMFARAVAAASAAIDVRLALQYCGYLVIAYYGAVSLFRDRGRLTTMLWLLIAALLLVSLYEVFCFALGGDPVFGSALEKYVPQKSNEFFRGGSTLGHPVLLGAFLVLFMPISVWGIGSARSSASRGFAAAALIAASVALILSFSKSAWISCAIIAAGMIYLYRRRLPKKALLSGLVVVVIVLAGLAWHGDLSFQLLKRDESYTERMHSWSSAATVLRENPVFGVGLFRGMIEIANVSSDFEGRSYPIDNYYLSVPVEQGMIGALLQLAVAFLLGATFVRACRRGPPEDRRLAALISIGVAGLALDAIFFDAFLIWPLLILFWVAAGIIRVLAGTHVDESSPASC